MNLIKHIRPNSFFLEILNEIARVYWGPLGVFLKEHPELIKTFPAFLLEQEQIVVYLGKTHLAIEYYGKETTQVLPESKTVFLTYFDLTDSEGNFFEDVVGFNYDSTSEKPRFFIPLPHFSEDLVFPTNKGMDKLLELKWNFDAQSAIIGINPPPFEVPKGEFCRIVNGRFFDADDSGLKTRHIMYSPLLGR